RPHPLSLHDALPISITQLTIQYTGEQWRLGATGRADSLDFSYSLDASSLATGSWLDVAALSFIGPVTSGSTGALDGNAAGNRSTDRKSTRLNSSHLV